MGRFSPRSSLAHTVTTENQLMKQELSLCTRPDITSQKRPVQRVQQGAKTRALQAGSKFSIFTQYENQESERNQTTKDEFFSRAAHLTSEEFARQLFLASDWNDYWTEFSEQVAQAIFWPSGAEVVLRLPKGTVIAWRCCMGACQPPGDRSAHAIREGLIMHHAASSRR